MAECDKNLDVLIGPFGRVVYCKLCPSNKPHLVKIPNSVFRSGYWYGIGQISKAKKEIRKHIKDTHKEQDK